MKDTTDRALKASPLAPAADLARRSRPGPLHRPGLLVALAVATLGLGLTARTSARAADMAPDLRVGHTVETMIVPGSTLCPDPNAPCEKENRPVAVHLWYPADISGFADAAKTVYTSALHGLPLFPGPDPRWEPLSWQVDSAVAREAPIDPHGPAFPVIVFSHGSTNDPIDYAPTLERIAGAGFVVAAPAHVNNTQDDERIDFINKQGGNLHPPVHFFDCRDGRPSPCSRTNVARSMEDRVRDVSHTLDNLPGWLGDRADISRVGVMGHSRGTVTALAAAGGSQRGTDGATPWHFGPDPRVDAVMGLAIGGLGITNGVDLADIGVPTLLVAGELDKNSDHTVSEHAFEKIKSTEKAYVPIPHAVHRSFDSAYCDELKSAGTITQAAGAYPDGEQKAPLDWHTVKLIGTSFPGGLSGKAHEYCSADTFRNPDLTPLMTSFNGLAYVDGQGRPTGETFKFPCRPDSEPCDPVAPTTGLETDEVKQGVADMAVTFFGTVLKRGGNDGPHFTQFLAPKWLEKQVPMVGSAQAFADSDAICPPGLDVVCTD